MDRPILVLNAGSSSIKFGVYADTDARVLAPIWRGKVEAIGSVMSLPESRCTQQAIVSFTVVLTSAHPLS